MIHVLGKERAMESKTNAKPKEKVRRLVLIHPKGELINVLNSQKDSILMQIKSMTNVTGIVEEYAPFTKIIIDGQEGWVLSRYIREV